MVLVMKVCFHFNAPKICWIYYYVSPIYLSGGRLHDTIWIISMEKWYRETMMHDDIHIYNEPEEIS